MKFLSPDNPIMRVMMILADLVFVQIFFVVCSLPVFTIGASSVALFSTMKAIEQDPTFPLYKTFFPSFMKDFKQATVTWLGIMLVGIILIVDIQFLGTYSGLISMLALILSYFLVFLLVFELVYVFPLIAWFKNGTLQTMKTAIQMALGNLGTTFFVVLIYGGIVLLAFSNVNIFLFLGISGGTYITHFLFKKLFQKYIPKEEITG